MTSADFRMPGQTLFPFLHPSLMLIICDIDGTLTDTNAGGYRLLPGLPQGRGRDRPGNHGLEQFPEVTDAAIVHELLKGTPRDRRGGHGTARSGRTSSPD